MQASGGDGALLLTSSEVRVRQNGFTKLTKAY